MNILLLSNGAPNYFYFFNTLVDCFFKDGAKITIAVDSKFSREENGLDKLGYPIHDFSQYFKNHEVDFEIIKRYSNFNLNAALLSDFERAQVYGFWSDEADIDYFDKLKSALLSYFEAIFEDHHIDGVLYENVSNSFAHFALFVAKNKGASYWGIGGTRLPGRFSITGDPLDESEIANVFDDIRAGRTKISSETRQWVTEYIQSIETIIPDYMKINGLDRIGLLHRYIRRDRIKQIILLLRHVFDNRTDAFQIGNPLRSYFNLFKRNVYRRLKVSMVQRLYKRPVSGEKFILYPMHFHPESSTSILSGTYLDEYEVIRNIAFNLPEGLRLYVKDHISAWGYPSLDFYKRIGRLPNVRLLGPNELTKQLIKQSEAVITLTSTVGYEALLLNKRVFLFGHVFYDFHKGVERIENPTKLWQIIQTGLAKDIDWDASYNNDFVCAYYSKTLPGILNLMKKGLAAVDDANNIYPIIKKSISKLNG